MKRKLNDEQIRDIRESSETPKELAFRHGVSVPHVRRIRAKQRARRVK